MGLVGCRCTRSQRGRTFARGDVADEGSQNGRVRSRDVDPEVDDEVTRHCEITTDQNHHSFDRRQRAGRHARLTAGSPSHGAHQHPRGWLV